jgi:hypothetical protein
LQLDGLFETLIGNPVTTAGNHRCMLPDGRRVPSGHGSIPLRPPGRAVRRRQAPPALERHTGLKDPRRPASRCALKLAQMPVGALREWQADQAAGGCRITLAGQRLGIHHGHRYAAGCEAHPDKNVPGRLREGPARQGLGASGSSAHVRLAAVRRWHGDSLGAPRDARTWR